MHLKMEADEKRLLNIIKEDSEDSEGAFKQFEEMLLDVTSEKIMKEWIDTHQNMIHERFGRKHQTLLHRLKDITSFFSF